MIMSQAKMLAYSVIVTSIVCILCYFYIDLPISLAINATHLNQVWYQTAVYLSLIATPKCWTLIAIIGLISSNRLPLLKTKILTLSGSILLAQTIGSLLKYLLGRARPILYLNDHFYGYHFLTTQSVYHSFPSGHSLTIFAITTAMALFYRNIKWLLFSFSILVAVSRVLLNEHYVSDVIAGAGIGMLSATMLRLIGQRVLSKLTWLLKNQ